MVNSWTGFYIGAGGGIGSVHSNFKGDETWTYADYTDYYHGELNGLGGQGAFGTVQIGYDAQLTGVSLLASSPTMISPVLMGIQQRLLW